MIHRDATAPGIEPTEDEPTTKPPVKFTIDTTAKELDDGITTEGTERPLIPTAQPGAKPVAKLPFPNPIVTDHTSKPNCDTDLRGTQSGAYEAD